MKRYAFLLLLFGVHALNLDYLDPTKLQTITKPDAQQNAAQEIINRYDTQNRIIVVVNPILFSDHKDVFSLRTANGKLYIRASTGVAAVWGFNYFLKKYCKSQIAWQVKQVSIPDNLPDVDETIVANDRFRYYQNVCTVSYSFVWWKVPDWKEHVEWMALNGINLALAPVAQEAAWAKVYREIGMTDDEIDQHFTGPAFLSWLRMGNVHGWGGPLLNSWHQDQCDIQDAIVDYMFQLGIVPIFPAFNGHVPKAFARVFPNTTFHSVQKWNKFGDDYCCGLFMDPTNDLLKRIGISFLKKISSYSSNVHIFTVDPFNEVQIQGWSTAFVEATAKMIYSTLTEFDNKAVWLLQNWMLVSATGSWPIARVKTFLTSVPSGRMLVLDLQAEQWPQYNLYNMYYGQPFIWCMLHNFGGTLGMFGNVITINKDVYEARARDNSTMIGIGLTPEGINQNYVVYDLMLESAWRKAPISDLDAWVADYAERRYACNTTSDAWKHLLRSVYSFDGLNMVRGKYVITRRPSFRIKPWAWYKSRELFEAFREFVSAKDYCSSDGYLYDLVDVTRQALQYRAEQLYLNLKRDRFSSSWVFNASMSLYLDAMTDIKSILETSIFFSANTWLSKAKSFARNPDDMYSFELNARNQITMWGPNGEISDYACKQWAELFDQYYIPRWSMFLNAALDAKLKNEVFDENGAQRMVRSIVEASFQRVPLEIDLKSTLRKSPYFRSTFASDPRPLAKELYNKWAFMPDLEDLPFTVIRPEPGKTTTLADVDVSSEDVIYEPTVVMFPFTTPLQ